MDETDVLDANVTEAVGPTPDRQARPRAGLRKRLRVPSFPASVWLCIVVLGGMCLAGLFAPLVAPYSPTAQDIANGLQGPSGAHLLGTDQYGRDVLSRLIWGVRSSIEGVAVAVFIALAVGVPWGLVAGYSRGWAGDILMRLADVLLSFPGLVLAITITAVLGPSLFTSMAAVGIVYSPFMARLTRVGVQSTRDMEYVLSAELSGCPTPVIMSRHILPAAAPPIIVQATVFAGLALIVESALSFLGLGVQPPTANWGGDLAAAYQFILVKPGQIIPASVVIAISALTIYRIGDYLRDVMFKGRVVEHGEHDEAVMIGTAGPTV